jgi:hypothetical protein
LFYVLFYVLFCFMFVLCFVFCLLFLFYFVAYRYAHKNGCAWDESTCSAAAKGGHLKCLQYVFHLYVFIFNFVILNFIFYIITIFNIFFVGTHTRAVVRGTPAPVEKQQRGDICYA